MSKMDKLRKNSGGNVLESMGAGVAPPVAGPFAAGFNPVQATPAHLVGVYRNKDAAQIAIERIQPDPAQPREEFDAESLERLAESMIARGQLQPIRVRWDEAAEVYRIICGERRWRAATIAGMPSLSCVIVTSPMSESDLLAVQLIENALREDLKPIEQARAYQTLMDRHGWSTRQLATELALAQPQVVRALALLNLPEEVQEQVEQGTLAPATAYEIGKLTSPEAQRELAGRVVNEKLTRQEAVATVRDRKAGGKGGLQRPEPVELRVNDAITVIVKYRKADRLNVIQALKAALKMAQEIERRDEEAA